MHALSSRTLSGALVIGGLVVVGGLFFWLAPDLPVPAPRGTDAPHPLIPPATEGAKRVPVATDEQESGQVDEIERDRGVQNLRQVLLRDDLTLEERKKVEELLELRIKNLRRQDELELESFHPVRDGATRPPG